MEAAEPRHIFLEIGETAPVYLGKFLAVERREQHYKSHLVLSF